MADSILRLKVESQEYDNKLKQAAQGLTRYVDECRKVGGTLEVVEKETLDYVRALGQMDTTSRTATGKLAEMKKTFTELSAQYKQMTDAEKASPFGKALAASLDELKGRIGESKVQLDEINKSINGGGGLTGALDAVAGKFGLSIDQVTKFGGVVGVATTALNVAKDAFFNNEEQLDEWGRVVESSHSLYTGFLNALNTGDISGYLNNISQIVQAARDAYDALDNLGTYNAFNQINVERTRTNMTESIADYRGGKGSKDTVKAAGDAYKKELQDRKRLENEAYLAAVKRVAAERGVSAKDLTDALSGTYGHYQDLKNVQPTGVRQTVVGSGMFARTGTETFAQTRQEKLGEALRHLNDTELQSLQALGAQAQRTGNEIAQVDKQLTRVLNGRQPGESGGGGKTGGKGGNTTSEVIYASDSIVAQQKLVQELTKQWNESGASVRDKYLQPLVEAEAKLKSMQNEMGLQKENAAGKLLGNTPDGKAVEIPISSDIAFQTWMTGIQEKLAGLKLNPIEIPIETTTKDVKAIAKAASMTADVVGSIGDAFNAIEDPAAKVMGTIAQAVASVALGYAQATVAASQTGNPWVWAAFAVSGLATMITMISQIHSATGYANGGVVKAVNGATIPGTFTVPGTTYSNDQIPAMLNAGETVLTRAQAGNIASQLQGAGGSINLNGVLTGENIFLSADRYARRSGRGELVTFHR